MNAIEINNVYKSFKVYLDKGATLKEKVLFRKRNRYEEHRVLQGINLTVRQGEVVGLIGENGCGKSTLLKLMTRIIYPDQGNIKVNGKISSLLELGAGFHPDMTGRENIYTNASIFGLNRQEIDKRVDKIIEFSELDEFIDNPVRTYSSGMYMRLAFAVAINVDAEILLVDEILAVGDASFQAKCFNKMQEIKRSGTTIVIVSHDLGSIERLCDRTVWINKGTIVQDGRAKEIIGQYLNEIMNRDDVKKEQKDVEENEELIQVEDSELVSSSKRWGNNDIRIKSIKLFNSKGKETTKLHTGEQVTLSVDFVKSKPIDTFEIGIGFNSINGVMAYGTNTTIDRVRIEHTRLEGNLKYILPEFNLLQGEYYLDIAFHTIDGIPFDYYCEALRFSVYSEISDVGLVRIKHRWTIDGKEVQ